MGIGNWKIRSGLELATIPLPRINWYRKTAPNIADHNTQRTKTLADFPWMGATDGIFLKSKRELRPDSRPPLSALWDSFPLNLLWRLIEVVRNALLVATLALGPASSRACRWTTPRQGFRFGNPGRYWSPTAQREAKAWMLFGCRTRADSGRFQRRCVFKGLSPSGIGKSLLRHIGERLVIAHGLLSKRGDHLGTQP